MEDDKKHVLVDHSHMRLSHLVQMTGPSTRKTTYPDGDEDLFSGWNPNRRTRSDDPTRDSVAP